MSGLLICAAVVAFTAGYALLIRSNHQMGPQGKRTAYLGVALIAVALWLAYAAGGA